MNTVVGAQWNVRAVNESGLSSNTPDIVQPDLTNTIGEASKKSNSTWIGQYSHELNLYIVLTSCR